MKHPMNRAERRYAAEQHPRTRPERRGDHVLPPGVTAPERSETHAEFCAALYAEIDARRTLIQENP